MCVTVCDCDEPNMVLAVEADLSGVVLEAFFHPTQLYADSMNQGHKQLRVCGRACACDWLNQSVGTRVPAVLGVRRSEVLILRIVHLNPTRYIICNIEEKARIHVVERDQRFHCVLYLKQNLLALDSSTLSYRVSNLNKKTCSYRIS